MDEMTMDEDNSPPVDKRGSLEGIVYTTSRGG